MYRIGIIGSENSHALAFTRIFNLSGQYEDMRVVGIAGEVRASSEKVFQEGQLEFIADKPQDFLGRVDAMMITSRHGGLHAGYARPFIEAGMPVFVDKPITDRAESTRTLLQLATEHHAPVMGGSSTRLVPDTLSLRDFAQTAQAAGTLAGGHVWAPVSMTNEYGGFCFYSPHLVEIALTVFGYNPLAVRAFQNSAGVTALLEYDCFTVHLSFTEKAYQYGGTVLTNEKAETHAIDVAKGYEIETAHFAAMVRTGHMPNPTEEMLLSVIVMNAVEAAFTSGQRVMIEII